MQSLAGKEILITGGAGTIGQALTAYITKEAPSSLITVIDRDKPSLELLKGAIPSINVLHTDIRSEDVMREAINGKNAIFHLAAEKDVVFCEKNREEAISTNFWATKSLLSIAQDHGVEQFIFTSSDKAANPSNLMGRTKYLAERLIIKYARRCNNTKFSAVRFGNVLGSSGSVTEIFTNQINNRQPLTITHHDMTRFVMSKKQAVKLLVESMSIAQSGDILVMDMPVAKITDIADVMKAKAKAKENLPVVHIGIREGESLSEALMTKAEMLRAQKKGSFFVINGVRSGARESLSLPEDSSKVLPLRMDQLKHILAEAGVLECLS